jgi:2-succinyl-5-enolpyruvyl-6-hydroxy-3-cyclohexene-1-carboxylate synthase
MDSHLRWTSHLLRAYYGLGVRHVILSPGSRSTPLTLAAAIHDGFIKKVVIDERSAAFMALGIGKATGIPALLICTSGTAAANYMPAVTEAKESGVPIIVLTADRPPHLRGIGSSQTVDQLKYFGDQAVFFHEAGEPVFKQADLRRLAYLAKQSLEAAVEKGGAAHVNMPFRKPLEPIPGEIESEQEINGRQISGSTAPVAPVAKRTLHLSSEISGLINNSQKPLVIAGPSNLHHVPGKQLRELAEKINAPVIAEPGSAISIPPKFSITRYEQFLRSSDNLNKLEPDLIIRFGDQPFTKSLLTAFERWNNDHIPVIHFKSREAAQDHSMSVSHTVFCSPIDVVELPAQGQSNQKSSEWLESWQTEDRSARNTLLEVLRENNTLTDGHIFSHFSSRDYGNWNVMLSNSFIPRDMALFGRSSENQFVNRGAAGIDGIISTAVGIHESTQRRTLCITGDIAFLHDSNALLSVRDPDLPFVILVINNGGGTIFRMLPVYQYEKYYTPYFETPQQFDIEHFAAAHGMKYKLIDSPESLESFNVSESDGAWIIECKTDPDASMKMRRKLWNT